MVICYLGVGSNLGDRRRNIKEAIRKINALKGTSVLKASRLIETEPQGRMHKQPKYLNGALKIKTNLPASALLNYLKKIETELGRPKRHPRLNPRTIDLDILFYANSVIKTKNLVVPHPRLFEREFVMRPLSEIYEVN